TYQPNSCHLNRVSINGKMRNATCLKRRETSFACNCTIGCIVGFVCGPSTNQLGGYSMKALVLAVVLGAVSLYAQTSTSTSQQNTGVPNPATSPQQNPNPSGATRPQNLSERGIE